MQWHEKITQYPMIFGIERTLVGNPETIPESVTSLRHSAQALDSTAVKKYG